MPSELYVLILAGGSGERFWPLSRRSRPKQLLALFSKETLLEATLRRLEGLVPFSNILILTNAEQEAGVRAVCPQLPPSNILSEPAKRDTAAAIALGAGWVSMRSPDATMIVLPADHVIQDVAGFQRTLKVAAAVAEETGDLVTIGIRPTWACPGFGYIEKGAVIPLNGAASDPSVSEVVRFREKPNAELAETFLKDGSFRWNAGMFIWTVRSIVAAFNRHVPALGQFVGRMHAVQDFLPLIQSEFPSLPKISIDYAVMEKASRVLLVEAAFDWDDVGSWIAAAKYLAPDEAGNHSNCAVKALEATNNIVFSDSPKTVALLGVHDLIVVQTADAILICHRGEAEKIKQLVAQAPAELQ